MVRCPKHLLLRIGIYEKKTQGMSHRHPFSNSKDKSLYGPAVLNSEGELRTPSSVQETTRLGRTPAPSPQAKWSRLAGSQVENTKPIVKPANQTLH